jgi:predicted dithiol-disulfide oxidoreductase (DUF899 family)
MDTPVSEGLIIEGKVSKFWKAEDAVIQKSKMKDRRSYVGCMGLWKAEETWTLPHGRSSNTHQWRMWSLLR